MNMNLKTNIRTLIVLLAATLAGAIGASGQAVSLADIGRDVYKSEADGFQIAVPHDCFKVVPTENGRTYVCNVREGRVVVEAGASDPPVNTSVELAAYLEGFRGTLNSAANVKVLSETPFHLGSYKGAAFQLTVADDKAFMTTMCSDRSTFTITAQALSAVPNSAKLMAAAVQSFAFTAKAK
jgi:hypothetical protein